MKNNNLARLAPKVMIMMMVMIVYHFQTTKEMFKPYKLIKSKTQQEQARTKTNKINKKQEKQ